MKVVIDLSEKELYTMMDLLDCEIQSEEDAEYAIHLLIENA